MVTRVTIGTVVPIPTVIERIEGLSLVSPLQDLTSESPCPWPFYSNHVTYSRVEHIVSIIPPSFLPIPLENC